MKNVEIQAKNLYRSVLEDHLTNIGPTNIGPVGPLTTPLEINQTVLTNWRWNRIIKRENDSFTGLDKKGTEKEYWRSMKMWWQGR